MERNICYEFIADLKNLNYINAVLQADDAMDEIFDGLRIIYLNKLYICVINLIYGTEDYDTNILKIQCYRSILRELIMDFVN